MPAPCVILTLARPDRRNSLSEAMLGALQAAIAEADARRRPCARW